MKSTCLFILFVFPLYNILSTEPQGTKHSPATSWVATQTFLNINNISTTFSNDGWADREQTTGNSGFEFPKGSRRTLVFQSGPLWGAKVRDSIHVGGSTYLSGLQPGRILSPGVAEDPNLPKNRIYRVRPDYATADLSAEMRDEGRPPEEIRAQYALDWNQWPATDGAPFDDRNNNGMYEPGIDVPGKKGADQTIWFVCNDQDTGRTRALYGTSPLGLEMQATIWGYNRPGALGNILFKNYRLINKSTIAFDSMFVAQWMDTDLGFFGDDLAGCDTTLDLWFTFNAFPFDNEYGTMTPPVFGFQFPNAHSYAMVQKCTGTTISDPPFTLNGSKQWYNWMRGLLPIDGRPFVDPLFPAQPTKYWIDGDPITGAGRIDRNGPGDRRGHATVGPWRMLPGEIRDVALAVMAGFGSTNVTGVTTLRNYARAARTMFPGILASAPPKVNAIVAYPNASQATVQIVADGRPANAQSVEARILRQDGSIVATVNLFDDGQHGDGRTHDGIWGNSVTIAREASGLYINANTVDSLTRSFTWERMYDNLSTAGSVKAINPIVFSDNINSDGQVNPGENIRYGFTVSNAGSFAHGGITLSPSFETEFKAVRLNSVPAGGNGNFTYNPNDTLSYFTFTAPPSGAKVIPFTISDSSDNVWRDTLRFPTIPFSFPIYTTPVTHLIGKSEWQFNVRAVDWNAITNHTYEITIVDSIDTMRSKGFELKDVTTGATLLSRQPLPDSLGHTVPVTAGFKVLQGDLFGRKGLRKDSTRWISNAVPWFRGSRFSAVWEVYSAFDGGVTPGSQLQSYFGDFSVRSNFELDRSYPVEVRFDIIHPQKAYRLGRSSSDGLFRIQEPFSFVNVPFSVWDVSNRQSPRQLTVAWRDQNGSTTWDPPTGSDGSEIVFIYNKTYDPTGTTQFSLPPNVIPSECTVGEKADIVYGLSLAVLSGHVLNENPGTLYLRPFFTLSSADHFSFTPSIGAPPPELPESYALFQNYPNPFNPVTTIKYQLPSQSRVSVRIFNVLGQEVKSVLDGVESAGVHLLQWDGRNNNGLGVASGVYFYRLEANSVGGTNSFRQVKKMLLLR